MLMIIVKHVNKSISFYHGFSFFLRGVYDRLEKVFDTK
jgi:hypothetical protein